MAGWCGGTDYLVQGMTAFAPEGSVVTIICECNPEVRLLRARCARPSKRRSLCISPQDGAVSGAAGRMLAHRKRPWPGHRRGLDARALKNTG